MATAKKTAPGAALAKEAEGDTVARWEYEDVTYEVDVDALKDAEVQLAIEEDKGLLALKLLLGPVQWRTFVAGRKTVSQCDDMISAMMEAIGVSLGESDG